AATGATLVINDPQLDFALVKLDNVNAGVDLASFGYLQTRSTEAMVNETVYAIGHPSGRPCHIAYVDDDGSPGRLLDTSFTPSGGGECNIVDRLAHRLDTDAGSSGSPVLTYADNLVVGLHNCGGCRVENVNLNSAVKMSQIVDFLGSRGLLPRDAVVTVEVPPTSSPTTSKPTPSPPRPSTPSPQPTKCSPIEENVDYAGFDLMSTQRVSATDCCADCNSTPGCKLFVWSDYSGGTCWLKSQQGAKTKVTGARAAILSDGSSPQPPPSSCGVIEKQTDFAGEDIAESSGPLESCCDACKANEACHAYSWVDDTCYLKGKRRDPSHNSNVQSARVYKCASIEANVDFVGHDVASVQAEAVEDCCAICRGVPECKAFSFARGVCYLKSAKDKTKTGKGVFSATA
ncbi:hypothetical protein As57867_006076, partial [Aphanomyces stellatus]